MDLDLFFESVQAIFNNKYSDFQRKEFREDLKSFEGLNIWKSVYTKVKLNSKFLPSLAEIRELASESLKEKRESEPRKKALPEVKLTASELEKGKSYITELLATFKPGISLEARKQKEKELYLKYGVGNDTFSR
jgi:hypothetical protein